MTLSAHVEPSEAWREIRARLRRRVGESAYEIWLAPLELKMLEDGVLTLGGPAAIQAWVEKRFSRVLEECAHAVLGAGVTVSFAVPQKGKGTPPSATSDLAPPLNPRYSFGQFIIGDGNRLAHAAALAVAELPGQAYNPLFLYAPPGLGKTHLLHAIGNYLLAFGGGAVVRYTTAEAFTNHFITALGSRSVERFKQAYRAADVLLIDDVQFLASKAKTEEEFFHTFNALYETGRQLVLTCDRLPRQLPGVEDRLRERFECGLVADIRPPDHATRVAILRKRAALDGIELADPAVLDLIAKRITQNVRLLEGALIRVVASHSLTGRPINVELARSVLDGMGQGAKNSAPTFAEIQAAVASQYEVTVSDLISSGRAARIAWPRQVAIYLTRELTNASLEAIGGAFGGRNHATVVHACKRVAERIANDPQATADIDELTKSIRAC